MALSLTIAQLFAPTVLTTGAATLYTNSGASGSVLVNGRIRVANTSAATHQVTLYAVPSGGSAGAGNCFANAESIAQNQHLDFDGPHLPVGATLQARADAGSVLTVTALAGTLITP